jgi:hypothetical protein
MGIAIGITGIALQATLVLAKEHYYYQRSLHSYAGGIDGKDCAAPAPKGRKSHPPPA